PLRRRTRGAPTRPSPLHVPAFRTRDHDLPFRACGLFGIGLFGARRIPGRVSFPDRPSRELMAPDDQPRNLKAMLSEAKDTSELMVDLAYAALFFGDARMANEVEAL